MRIYIGSKRYSSWSLRPWLALKWAGLAFEEHIIPFESEPGIRNFSAGTKAAIAKISPSGRVPSLHLEEGGTVIHESLAICEAANELAGGSLWPADFDERAQARAMSCELHSQFTALRLKMPLCCGVGPDTPPASVEGELGEDIARLEAMVAGSGAGEEGNDFLFGPRSIADAMMAPYMLRLHFYRYPVSTRMRAYIDALLRLPETGAWIRAGAAEPPLIPDVEFLARNFPRTGERTLKL